MALINRYQSWKEFLQKLITNFVSEQQKNIPPLYWITKFTKNTVIRALFFAVAKIAEYIQYLILRAERSMFPDTAVEEELDRLGTVWGGQNRRAAAKSSVELFWRGRGNIWVKGTDATITASNKLNDPSKNFANLGVRNGQKLAVYSSENDDNDNVYTVSSVSGSEITITGTFGGTVPDQDVAYVVLSGDGQEVQASDGAVDATNLKIFRSDLSAFLTAGVRVGMVLTIYGSTNNDNVYTISEVLNENQIKLDRDLVAETGITFIINVPLGQTIEATDGEIKVGDLDGLESSNAGFEDNGVYAGYFVRIKGSQYNDGLYKVGSVDSNSKITLTNVNGDAVTLTVEVNIPFIVNYGTIYMEGHTITSDDEAVSVESVEDAVCGVDGWGTSGGLSLIAGESQNAEVGKLTVLKDNATSPGTHDVGEY
jgi:hypothetical protein